MSASVLQFMPILLCFFLNSRAYTRNVPVVYPFQSDSNVCLANAGALVVRGSTTPCISTGPILLSATHAGGIGKDPSGAPNKIYILTRGDELTIIQMGMAPQFMVEQPGKYRIHTLMYDTSNLDLSKVIPGVSPASYIYNQLIQAGGTLCGNFDVNGAKYEVTECLCTSTAFAGRLNLPEREFCNPDFYFTILVKADLISSPIIPKGFKMVYLLSRGNSLLINRIIDPKSFTEHGYFTIEAFPETWRIHSLVYNPVDPGWENILKYNAQMSDVLSHLKQGGGKMCGDLDKGGAIFTVKDCNSKARVGVLGYNTIDQPCFEGSALSIKAGALIPSVVPSEYILKYVLSEGNNLVVKQIKEAPIFSVAKEGVYRIHIVIFHPQSFNINAIELGKTTLFEIRDSVFSPHQPFCGSIDMLGSYINIYTCPNPPDCDLSLIEGSNLYQTCLPFGGKVRLRTNPPTSVNIPGDYQLRYVLTSGDSLILKNISTTPDFQVSKAGRYRIHVLVYNPHTLDLSNVFDGVTPAREIVDQFIPERKGGKTCAYWTSGIPFDVLDCMSSICEAYAGSLKPIYQTCVGNIAAQIRATVVTNPIVPKSYLVRYVLTKGNDLIIEGFSNFADFKVNGTGQYRIHTMVYDPYTLDLGGIIFGRTNLYLLITQFTQSAGRACGAIDKDGALFEVQNCDCPPAFSGRIKPLQQVCYDGINQAVITGITDLPAIVPPNFRQVYIFSSGENMVIEKAIDSKYLPDPRYIEYIQVKSGLWRIHSFVYNPKDQIINNLLSNYRVSRVMDIYSQLAQGGGQYCGFLDVLGAIFNVEECSCSAKAGTLSANSPCLNTSTTKFSAKVNIPSVVPYGFQLRYVLSQGDSLVVRQVREIPEFNINQPGRYRIHTLVYHVSTLNPRNIRPGKTTIRDIHHLIYKQDNFSCGSINLFGEAFAEIKTCNLAVLAPNFTQTLPEMATTLVFPNPTNDRVYLNFHSVETKNEGSILIELLDITGRTIRQIKHDLGTGEGEIDMTGLPSGLYLLRVLKQGQNPELIRINKI